MARSAIDYTKAIELYNSGMTLEQVSGIVGKTAHALFLALKRRGITFRGNKVPKLTEKRCKMCGIVKPISEFSKHPTCPNGLGRCKPCQNVIFRERMANPERAERFRENQQAHNRTKDRRKKKQETWKKLTVKYPEKHKARYTVHNHLRAGTLKKQPCEVCGNPKSQAHHDDYSRPLDVQWLCKLHHYAAHGKAYHYAD